MAFHCFIVSFVIQHLPTPFLRCNDWRIIRMLSPTVLLWSLVWSHQPLTTVALVTPSRQGIKRHVSLGAQSQQNGSKSYRHILAILTVPRTSIDRIANEAILETSMRHVIATSHSPSRAAHSARISVVLRRQDGHLPKLNELRGYVGEIYSMAWDCALGLDSPPLNQGNTTEFWNTKAENNRGQILDVIVYPQNLPNSAPERWIYHRPELDCICSHDTITGWVSLNKGGTGMRFSDVPGSGVGGLAAHVQAVNMDRQSRGLPSVDILPVENWPPICDWSFTGSATSSTRSQVVFMEDDVSWNPSSPLDISTAFHGEERNGIESFNNERIDNDADTLGERFLMGAGYQLPSSSLFNSVAVGGTFDSLHYGHRKLLTLAVSAVVPTTGKLLIGITTDEMLQSKAYAEYIPKLNERIQGVRDFVDSLAPGMKNRVRIVPIRDKYGPPGVPSDSDVYTGIPNDFDALVLSHETLPTGQSLNEHRVTHLGLPPLTLLCTRRTEAHGMSSTALRRMKRLYDETSSATTIGSP